MPSSTQTDIEARAADWLAQRDGAHWSTTDAQALEAWLAADTRHRVALLRLQAHWQQAGRLQALGAGWVQPGPPPRNYWQSPINSRREQMLQAATQRSARRKSPLHDHWPQFASMAILVGCCTVLLSWAWHHYTHVDVATYRSAVGEIRTQPLQDGSQATLASNTRIDVQLARTHRDVTLVQGESIFEVAKDPQRPFAVAVGGYRAVAVGTRFSVRRDRDDLRVVVTEGTVRLDAPSTDGHASPSSLLPAGSVALVHGGSVLVRSLSVAEAGQLLGWRDGWLVFRDTPLQEAVAEFNRYNTRKLRIADAEAGALRIGGSFRWDNQEAFVRLLEAGFPVHADTTPTQITLSSR